MSYKSGRSAYMYTQVHFAGQHPAASAARGLATDSTLSSQAGNPAMAPNWLADVLHSGNVAVVTGSSSGIGRAVARRCASVGMHVFLADIDARMLPEAEAEIQSLAAPHGGSATGVVTDVSDAASVANLRDTVLAAHPTVHYLHCNAGLELPGGVRQPLGNWETTLGVNLFGVVHTTKAFLEHMIDRGEPGA
eukprot:COSAG03_NODE_971_length_5145_cov_18.676774_2_plen_192_part_00